jgi:hypothetical protein
MATLQRAERLQIMLTEDELAVLDDWRFARRMPSRAAAIRELLRRGLAAEGFAFASAQTQSKEFGVIARSKRKPAALQRDGRNNRDGHNGGA